MGCGSSKAPPEVIEPTKPEIRSEPEPAASRHEEESFHEPEQEEEEEIIEEEQYGTYTPFSEFPTPALLSQAQDEYTAANVRPEIGDQGLRLPFPPPARKSDVFNLKKSATADEQTLEVPLSAAERTYTELMEKLTAHCSTDIQKVRSFFVWISSQSVRGVVRHVETLGLENLSVTSPLYLLAAILVARKGGSYADLLAQLCREAGVPVRVVQSELVRGVYSDAGDDESALKASNTHCIVYVGGAWRIIDQHWGSQGVIASASPDWELIAGREAEPNSEEEGALVYRRNEYFFLVDPERYIFQQWAPNMSDQLLARPVRREEFPKLAFIRNWFFEMGFISINPSQCVINSTNGRVAVTINFHENSRSFFDYTLFKSKFDEEQNEIDGHNLDRYVRGEMMKNSAKFEVSLRKYGTHRLQLWAGPDRQSLEVFCEIRIECEEPDFINRPLPYEKRMMFGLNPRAKYLQIEADEDQDGVIEAYNGVAELQLHYAEQTFRDYQIYVELSNQDFAPATLQNNVRYYLTEEYLSVIMYMSQHGDYVLSLNTTDDEGNRRKEFGKYLVRSTRKNCFPTPFPKSTDRSSKIGDMNPDFTRPQCIKPDSHPDPIIQYEDKEESLRITVDIEEEGEDVGLPGEYSAKLFHYNEKGVESDCTMFIFTHLDGTELHTDIRFYRPGTYKLNIMNNDLVLYQYIIHAREISNVIDPYPKRQANWKNSYRLIEPGVRQLENNQTVRFKLEAMEAEEVYVLFRGRRFNMVRNEEDDSWEGDLDLARGTGDLVVCISESKEQSEGKDCAALVYKVENSADFSKIQQQMSQYQTMAEKWKENLKNAERQEKLDEQKRLKKEDDDANEKQQEFRKNKEKYKTEEKVFIRREKQKKEEQKFDEFSSEKVNDDFTMDDLMKAKEAETKEARGRQSLWQREYEKMKPMLAIVRLREAVSSGSSDHIRVALDECRARKDMQPYEQEIETAEIEFTRIELRKALEEATRSGDVEQITLMIEEIEKRRYAWRLDPEIRHAKSRIEIIRMMSTMNRGFLGLRRDTLMELKSYRSPPPVVPQVMKAFYLLLGEDESKTEDWKYCVKICQTQGKNKDNLMYRVAGVKPSELHPEIVARSSELLRGVNPEELRKVSGAAATFCIWTKGMIVEARKTKGMIEEARKASRGQQNNRNDKKVNRNGSGQTSGTCVSDNQSTGYSSLDDVDYADGDDGMNIRPASVQRQREIFAEIQRNRNRR